MSLKALDHRFLQYGRYGSFWNENFSGKTLKSLHALTQMGGNSGAVATVRSFFAELAPTEMFRIAAPSLLLIDKRKTSYLGPDVQQRIRTITPITALDLLARPTAAQTRMPFTGRMIVETEQVFGGIVGVIQDEFWQYLFAPADDDGYTRLTEESEFIGSWLVPSDVIPLHLRDTRGNDYLPGIHFWPRDGAMVWHRDPESIFRDNCCTVMAGAHVCDNLLNYTWQVEPLHFGGEYIAQYYQDRVSVDSFVKALAQACNFFIMPVDDRIVYVQRHAAGTIYEFANYGLVRLDYPHRIQSVGTEVQAGTILGNPIEAFYSKGLGDNDWWQLSALERIEFDSLIPPLPCRVGITRSCRADWVESTVVDGATKYHARLHLPAESPADLEKFWGIVKRSELLTGKFLNDEIGLDGGTTSTLVEPLNICFKHFLGQRGIILQQFGYEHWGDDCRDRFTQFVDRARPSLSIIITVNVPTSDQESF